MACGCSDICLCYVEGAGGVVVTGDGSSVSPYVISPPAETTFAATNSGGGISITPGGTAGHTPDLNLVIDPASTAPVSVSASGLLIDCCAASGLGVDTITVDTLLDASYGTVLVETDISPVQVTLPAVHAAGLRYEIKDFGNAGLGNTEVNALTVDPNGSAIDGSLSIRTFAVNGESITIVSNGTDWAIV